MCTLILPIGLKYHLCWGFWKQFAVQIIFWLYGLLIKLKLLTHSQLNLLNFRCSILPLNHRGSQHHIPEHLNCEKYSSSKYLKIDQNVKSHELKCTYYVITLNKNPLVTSSNNPYGNSLYQQLPMRLPKVHDPSNLFFWIWWYDQNIFNEVFWQCRIWTYIHYPIKSVRWKFVCMIIWEKLIKSVYKIINLKWS